MWLVCVFSLIVCLLFNVCSPPPTDYYGVGDVEGVLPVTDGYGHVTLPPDSQEEDYGKGDLQFE